VINHELLEMKPRFNPKVAHVVFVVNKVKSLPIVIIPMPHTNLLSEADTIGPFEATIPKDSVSLNSYN
jgi:hypothetical protein